VNARSERHAGVIRRLFLLLLAVVPLTALFLLSSAEGRVPGVTVTVKPGTALVGDRIHWFVEVLHQGSGTPVLEGIDSLSVQPFELISRRQSSSVVSPDIRKERFDIELAVFGSGRQPLPPFTVVLRDSEGKVLERITGTPGSMVLVKAITDSSMHDLRPIKPPVKPGIPFFLLLVLIVGVFSIAGLLLLVIFFLKRTLRTSAEHVDPWHVAQRKLRKLGSSLSAGMPPPECYEELSNIMRTFLEKHYRIRALEAVTQEIERDLKKLGVAGFENIMNLLKQADLVKFADSRPDIEESRQSLQNAEEVIRSSRAPNSDGPAS